MIKFNLDVNYDLPKTREVDGKEVIYTAEEISEGNAQLTNNYIETAIIMVHKDGLNSQYRRLWVKTQSKLSTAIAIKDYEVEFEQGEFDFIKNAIIEAKFNATIAKYIVTLEDAILSV